jgi:hypothetical protein
MTIAATGLYMNWVNVTVTPQGGSAIDINGVTALTPMRASRQEAFYGDARQFVRLIKNVEKKRSITIMAANVGALSNIPDDTPCTVVATLLDPRNGIATGGGAITITLLNAVLEKDGIEAQNNKYAGGQAVFNAFGVVDTDGVESDPLTYAFV